jgi:histidinol-phosphate/aromatic aminotransferase/cobyric acid decarboxylase-like protein
MYLAGIASFCDSFPPAVAEWRPEVVFARTLSKQSVDYGIAGVRRRGMQTNEGRWASY